MKPPFDLVDIVRSISYPLSEWPGNCYAVCQHISESGLTNARVRYGLYSGPIAPDGKPFGGRLIARHAWLATDDMIIDPTRWVFENVKPYVYATAADDQEYDLGMSRYRQAQRMPWPVFDPKARLIVLPEKRTWVLNFLAILGMPLDSNYVNPAQIARVCSLPKDVIEGIWEFLYPWVMVDLNMPGLIPIDMKRLFVEGLDDSLRVLANGSPKLQVPLDVAQATLV